LRQSFTKLRSHVGRVTGGVVVIAALAAAVVAVGLTLALGH
jgi:hypothetical protein